MTSDHRARDRARGRRDDIDPELVAELELLGLAGELGRGDRDALVVGLVGAGNSGAGPKLHVG